MAKLQKILLILDSIPVETFKNKKHDYMKAKVNNIKENSKNKNIWQMYKAINECDKER